jgi:hypothetical protein
MAEARRAGPASQPSNTRVWILIRYPTDRRDPPVRRGTPSSSSSPGRQSDGELHVPTVFEDHRSTSLTATSSPLSFRAYWQVSEVIHARNPNWNRRRIPAVAVAVAAMSTSLSSFKTPQSTTREPWCFSTLSVSQHISSSRNHRGRRRLFPGEPPLEATPEAVKRSMRSA